jgi:methionyl aminopeptidase
MLRVHKKHRKTDEQIAQMRQAGLLVWQAHQVAAEMVQPGVNTGEIDVAIERFLADNSAVSLFKGVPGVVPFPAATCISTNEEVVHGIPGRRRLRAGDVVSIDIGVRLSSGWCGDAAVTRPVGEIAPDTQRLLDVTEGTLRLAIRLLREKRRWSHVAREMAAYVRRAGFSVVEELAGHSIGRALWEGLQVPNFTSHEFEQKGDFALDPGLVLAIEPMVNMGTRHIEVLPDQWTLVTADGRPSAHFEHTVALTKQGPLILTAGPDGQAWATE